MSSAKTVITIETIEENIPGGNEMENILSYVLIPTAPVIGVKICYVKLLQSSLRNFSSLSLNN